MILLAKNEKKKKLQENKVIPIKYGSPWLSEVPELSEYNWGVTQKIEMMKNRRRFQCHLR